MKKFIPFIFLSVALLVSACSGESDTQQEAATSEMQEETEAVEGRTIEVYGIDQMKFVVEEDAEGIEVGDSVMVNDQWYYLLTGIHANPGEQLNVKLTTISQLPPSAMSHNWVLLPQDSDVGAFNTASIKAKDNGYIAPDMEDMVMYNTGMLGGGESATVSFAAPEETGDYPYLCTFPGHYLASMKGTLWVAEEGNGDSGM